MGTIIWSAYRSQLTSEFSIKSHIYPFEIHRGPKLEGCAFANFGNSSGTEGKSRHEIDLKIRINKLFLRNGSLKVLNILSSKIAVVGKKKKGRLIRVL